jgi:hypothetical protein
VRLFAVKFIGIVSSLVMQKRWDKTEFEIEKLAKKFPQSSKKAVKMPKKSEKEACKGDPLLDTTRYTQQ